jgi:hypothetical protein
MTKADKIRELRAKGMAWRAVAREVGRSPQWCRSQIDPEYAAEVKRVKHEGERRARERMTGRIHLPEPRIDVEAAFATIIPDNRTWQQRAFGDPKPGQSALDQKQGVAR